MWPIGPLVFFFLESQTGFKLKKYTILHLVTEQEPYGPLTSASALIDRFNMASVGKIFWESNRISSQRHAIVTTHFFHFKWLIAKLLNFRILFEIASDDHPCYPMI